MTRPARVALSGELRGNVAVSQPTGTPKITAAKAATLTSSTGHTNDDCGLSWLARIGDLIYRTMRLLRLAPMKDADL